MTPSSELDLKTNNIKSDVGNVVEVTAMRNTVRVSVWSRMARVEGGARDDPYAGHDGA